ncbi:hypothetical protein D3C84_563970 [compost metagenome]
MNRPQHRPRDIVGVDLIAGHHQQCRAVLGCMLLRQQPVDAEQAVCRRVVRLAARTVQQLIDPCAQDEVRATRIAIQQVRRPFGDTFAVFQQQVVFDTFVTGQSGVQRHIDQMHEGMAAYRNDRALPGIQSDVGAALQAQAQLQCARSHQP